MNLRKLRYFVSVLEAGTMTKAADRLHVAQTALGMQIRQLEEDIGVELLMRHSRGVSPTPAGRLLHERAIEILRLVEQVRHEVASVGGASTEAIRLGTTPALMPVIGPEIALTLRNRLPHVALSMVEAMSHVLFEHLTRGDVDFILAYDVPDHPQFKRTALLQDDLVLVSLPGLHGDAPVAFADALEETLAIPEQGDTVRAAVTKQAADHGVELRVAYEVRSVSAMKNLVIRGAACSILPYFAVADEVRGGLLQARPITLPAVRRTLYLACAAQRPRFRNEAGLTSAVRDSLGTVVDVLGPLAHHV